MEVSSMIMYIPTELAQSFAPAPTMKSPLAPLLSKRGG
jgi:hypothetical protein